MGHPRPDTTTTEIQLGRDESWQMLSAKPIQPVVQVWIREQKLLKNTQGLFVESAHGDGHAQAAGEARGVVDRAHGVGIGAGASFLSAFE